MGWLHYIAWAIFVVVAVKAIRFGWKHSELVSKVLDEAGHSVHRPRNIRPLTEAERRAVLNTPNPRHRGRQSAKRRVVDPELLSSQDLDGLEEMFGSGTVKAGDRKRPPTKQRADLN